MVAQDNWNNEASRTAVHRREGGPGNPWKLLSENATMDAPSGFGRQTAASSFGRNSRGQLEFQGTLIQGTPGRTTANVMAYIDDNTFPNGLLGDLRNGLPCGCKSRTSDIRAVLRCGDMRDLNNWDKAIGLLDAISTGTSPDNALATVPTNEGQRLMWQESIDAGVAFNYEKLTHLDISKTTFTADINRVIWYCEDEYWVALDGDGSATAGSIAYTTDRGNTWTTVAVNVFTGTDNAVDIVIAGRYVVVTSDTAGVAYATVADIKNAVPNPFTLSSGFGTDYPNALATVNGRTVWAVADGGVILRSLDSGLSWTVFDNAGTTSENLTAVHFQNDNLGWFGGANGALVRYSNGSNSLIAITGSVTDAVTVVRTARFRDDEVFVGTDAGNIYRANNAQAATPTFAAQTFSNSGNGSIEDMQFAGFKGDVLFVVQTNASSESRVLRDLSGGAFGADVEIIETFTTPSNSVINSIAPFDPNEALTVGQIDSTNAFVGIVQR